MIAWCASFALAMVSALWMRSLGYGWSATLAAAVVISSVPPYFISRFYAVFMLRPLQRRTRIIDGLTYKIAVATMGMPPEERETIAKRMTDDALDGR
jgi:hypothetical protein